MYGLFWVAGTPSSQTSWPNSDVGLLVLAGTRSSLKINLFPQFQEEMSPLFQDRALLGSLKEKWTFSRERLMVWLCVAVLAGEPGRPETRGGGCWKPGLWSICLREDCFSPWLGNGEARNILLRLTRFSVYIDQAVVLPCIPNRQILPCITSYVNSFVIYLCVCVLCICVCACVCACLHVCAICASVCVPMHA